MTPDNTFAGTRKTLKCTQLNPGRIEEVFSLLCPVREADWLDGWEYAMIFSKSGFAELNCVFTTPHHGKQLTIWQVTTYDPHNGHISFLRFTPSESIVRIDIALERTDSNETLSHIIYTYTGLSDEQNQYIHTELEASFYKSMKWWERSLNHYLLTGNKLRRDQ